MFPPSATAHNRGRLFPLGTSTHTRERPTRLSTSLSVRIDFSGSVVLVLQKRLLRSPLLLSHVGGAAQARKVKLCVSKVGNSVRAKCEVLLLEQSVPCGVE